MEKPFAFACALASVVSFGACAVYAQTAQRSGQLAGQTQAGVKSPRPVSKVSIPASAG